jgi:hypothetical protein
MNTWYLFCNSGEEKQDLEERIYIVGQNFQSCGIVDDCDKIAALANYVKGNALKTLRAYMMGNENPDCTEYFAQLLKLVREDAKGDNLKNKLLDLKEVDNFKEFLLKFQELELRIRSGDGERSDEHAIFAFKRALKPKVKFEFEKEEITDLENGE